MSYSDVYLWLDNNIMRFDYDLIFISCGLVCLRIGFILVWYWFDIRLIMVWYWFGVGFVHVGLSIEYTRRIPIPNQYETNTTPIPYETNTKTIWNHHQTNADSKPNHMISKANHNRNTFYHCVPGLITIESNHYACDSIIVQCISILLINYYESDY